MLELRKWFQDWRERRENMKIQRVISKKYDRDAIPIPDNLDLSPDSIYQFAYIHYKAFSFLTVGPKVYRKQDYFNFPPEDWNDVEPDLDQLIVRHDLRAHIVGNDQ